MYIETDDLSKEISWLAALREKISTVSSRIFRPNISGKPYKYDVYIRTRSLTLEEWEHFLEIAPLFVVEPHNAECGFNFGIRLWHPANNIEKPEPIFSISGEYLPESMGQRFESAWHALSPLSHNPKNEAMLLRHGFNPLQEKGSYDY